MTKPSNLATLIADEPLWIDLRGLLLTDRCDVWSEPDPSRGLVARSWDFPFASLHGEVRPELIIAAAAAQGRGAEGSSDDEWQLLAVPESRPLVEAALPGWKRRGIVLHRWQSAPAIPDVGSEVEIRLLLDGHRNLHLDLGAFPVASQRELSLDWVSERPIAVAMIDSRPVSYCWAAFVTDRLWDVAIETLEPYRRRGLAAACFLELADHMAGLGKTPAWGAMEDNPGSLGLAAKLGFVPDASLDGWARKG